MLETVYLTDALFVRVAENESFATVLGERALRIETTLAGVLADDINSDDDDDLDDDGATDGIVIDTTTDTLVDVDEVGFFSIFFFDEGQRKETTFLFIDADSAGGPTFDSYVLPVAGDPFPPIAPGTDFFGILDSLNGGELPDPPGFTDSNFVAFDDLDNFERLGAIEGSTGISTEDARTVAYFYEAAYNRQPDLPGLNFWINQFENGLDFEAMGEFFIESPEFVETYGDIDAFSNREFVRLLYDNVLGRGSDAPGEDFWTGILDAGNSRSFVIFKFAESGENIVDSRYILGLDEIDKTPGVWEFV